MSERKPRKKSRKARAIECLLRGEHDWRECGGSDGFGGREVFYYCLHCETIFAVSSSGEVEVVG